MSGRELRALDTSEDSNPQFARALRRARRSAAQAATRARERLQALEVEEIAEELRLQEEQQELPIMANNNQNQEDQGQPQQLPPLLSLANTNPYTNLSNITSENGRRLWRQATEPLVEQFDGTHQHFQVFTANITNRFRMCNWFRFITFQVDGRNRDLITNPGLIPLAEVQNARADRSQVLHNAPDQAPTTAAAINTYNQAVIAHLHCTMMYYFLVNSIVAPLKTHISQKILGGHTHEDGPLLLKFIQQKVKGRANKQAVQIAHNNLNKLSLKEFKFNLKKFHDYVNQQVLTITNNADEVNNGSIAAALVEAYLTCSNEEFVQYIRHLETVADETNVALDFEDLMTKAETRYDKLIQNKTWGQKAARDEQILALQAQIKHLEKGRKSGGSGNGNSHGKGPRNDRTRRYPDWQYEKPKDGVKHIQKKIKGKMVDYWWCDVLQMWARHKPEDCKAKPRNDKNNDRPSNANNNNSGANGNTGTNNNNNNNRNPRLQAQQTTLYVLDDDSAGSQE